MRLKTADQMSPNEALLRSFDYNERFTPEEHAKVRTCLEHAVQQAPGYADCWAMLSVMYSNEYGHWDNARPDSLERALRAARTAVEAAPLSSLPYYALALALFFRREIPAFRVAAERAVSLNPMDGATVAFMGLLIAYAGDWERGCALSEKGSQLNPNHPGWYGYTAWHNAYRKKDYRGALDVALKLNAPNNFYTYSVLAITHAQLGEMEEAHKALRHLLALKPDFAKVARKVHGMWIEPDLVEHLMDGLRKAGLEIAPEKEEAAPAPGISRSPAKDASGADSDRGRGLRSDSGSSRAQAFWIAVLPFTHSGADPELESFAEGLAEDVTAGLARFPYLSVISRNSTLRFKGQTSDVRAVGEQLGARYVLEGGIRKGASTIRINIQLIDTQTGAHLWAETYNRDLKKSDIFSVQDDLTDRVVATVADAGGVLVRSMAADVEEKPEAELTASDWMLRQFSYRRRLTPEEHAKLREGTERFAEREPKHAEVWACLAQMCIDEFCFGFNRRPDALDRALAAARRSVDLDRTFPYGNQILAQVQFFRRDIPAFRTAAEQAMALNSRDTDTLAMMGLMLAHIGEFERGAKIVRRAMDLNPHHAGWFHFALIWEYFQKGDYEKALEQATRVNMPGLFWQPLAVACICGLLGRQAEAAAAVQELRKLDKDIELHARENIDCWHYSSGLMDRILEGLSKAGLDVPAAGAERTPDRVSGTRKGKKSVTRPPGA